MLPPQGLLGITERALTVPQTSPLVGEVARAKRVTEGQITSKSTGGRVDRPYGWIDNPQLRCVTRGLFDRHGFGEIAGLIDITAAFERHIIGEQLQRNHIE